MKIEKSNQIINLFGGINFVIQAIKQSGVFKLIDSQLASRPPQTEYSSSDFFLNLWSVFFLGDFLKDTPGLAVANADNVLGVLKSMKTEKEQVVSEKGNVYEINRYGKLSGLKISILKHLRILKEGKFRDFDYDNEVMKTGKYDTKKTYKMVNGYFPDMATIGGIPVYFENRDGNMNVTNNQDELLERCYKVLNDNGVHINRSRMDAGSYSKKIIDVVEKQNKLLTGNHLKSG